MDKETKMISTEVSQLSVRIADELHRWLKVQAAKERTSLATYVEAVLSDHQAIREEKEKSHG